MMASPTATEHRDGEGNTWFDRIVTPLNACSLETFAQISEGTGLISHDVGKSNDGSESECQEDGVVPLIIGCYQLNEKSQEASTAEETRPPLETQNDDTNDVIAEKSSRSGELRLHMIPSTTFASKTTHHDGRKNNNLLAYGDPACVLQMESGVLDGKWRRRGWSYQPSVGGSYETVPLFASACASGRIHLHTLERNISLSSKENVWTLPLMASSERPCSEDETCLCLSLAWNDFLNSPGDNTDQIVSSYSNGSVALHKVSKVQSKDIPGEMQGHHSNITYSMVIEETHRWNAHTMFGCPSEVWTCSFLRGEENVVLSGADDCSLKIWDTRSTQRPTHKIGDSEFEAGVTAISPHPSVSHSFAVGSYDEYVRIYDHRKIDQPMTKCHVGGGVWRIKWHPSCWEDEAVDDSSRKMLVAAMHGGCRVVNVPLLGADEAEILTKFTAHESMAYGADWLWFGKSRCEAAATCSFYDRQAFIWDP